MSDIRPGWLSEDLEPDAAALLDGREDDEGSEDGWMAGDPEMSDLDLAALMQEEEDDGWMAGE
jgi:hypothetical protein